MHKMRLEKESIDAERAANTKVEKKKTKKQLEKEALEAEKEKLQSKSLKSIYISLSKILHPYSANTSRLKSLKNKIDIQNLIRDAHVEICLPLLDDLFDFSGLF